MNGAEILVIACGVVALLYGFVTSRQVLAADAGTARMQEISSAVPGLAPAPILHYNRQYRTIAIVTGSLSSSFSAYCSAGGSRSAI